MTPPPDARLGSAVLLAVPFVLPDVSPRLLIRLKTTWPANGTRLGTSVEREGAPGLRGAAVAAVVGAVRLSALRDAVGTTHNSGLTSASNSSFWWGNSPLRTECAAIERLVSRAVPGDLGGIRRRPRTLKQ